MISLSDPLADVLAELARSAPEAERVVSVQCACGASVQVLEHHAKGAQCQPCAQRSAIERRRAEALLQALEALPPAVRDSQFGVTAGARITATKADQRLAGVAALAGRSLTLQGPPGSGKSSLAAAIARRVLETSVREENGFVTIREIRWVNAFELSMARAHHPLGQGEAPLVLAAKRVDTLVLDDFGLEPNVPTSAVLEVVMDRSYASRPTWITTGLTADEVAARYGGGPVRRVFEVAQVVYMGAPHG